MSLFANLKSETQTLVSEYERFAKADRFFFCCGPGENRTRASAMRMPRNTTLLRAQYEKLYQKRHAKEKTTWRRMRRRGLGQCRRVVLGGLGHGSWLGDASLSFVQGDQSISALPPELASLLVERLRQQSLMLDEIALEDLANLPFEGVMALLRVGCR